MSEYICSECGKEIDGSEAYEYRGIIACENCFSKAQENRDYERAEIIKDSKHRTDRFKGLDLGNSTIGKINRQILKPDIEIAKKESGRRKAYEAQLLNH